MSVTIWTGVISVHLHGIEMHLICLLAEKIPIAVVAVMYNL